MKKSGGKDLDTEGLGLLRVSQADQCKAAWNVFCNAQHSDEAALFLDALGLTVLQAKRGRRIAAGHV